MNDERPEALLKSALEKIIYFEARSEQLANDLAAARKDADRLKGELTFAAQREIELRRQMAEHEVQIRRGHEQRDELTSIIEALRAERAELISKLIEASRIHSAGDQEEAPFDLASFISQLRSEALAQRSPERAPAPAPSPPSRARPEPLAAPPQRSAETKVRPWSSPLPASAPSPALERQPKTPPSNGSTTAPPSTASTTPAPPSTASTTPAPVPTASTTPAPPLPAPASTPPVPTQSPVAQHAERLFAEGRLHVSVQQLEELAQKSAYPVRTEETLFGFSVRELASSDPAARARAAERLKALGQPAAGSPLASALMAENEPTVLVAELSAFATLAKREGAAVVARHLEAPVPEVRIAALKALLTLDPGQAGPYLSAAMKDPDPSVRRRASLLALGLGPESALELGRQAIADDNPEVRRLGALALSATGGDKARGLLLEAVRDKDLRVRRVAAQGLSRLLGRDVSSLVDLDDAQQRREIRRLLTAPAQPFSAPAPLNAPQSSPTLAPKPEWRALEPSSGASALVPEAAARTEGVPAGAVVLEESLCEALLSEVRCAIRGRTAPELCTAMEQTLAPVESACELLVARGQLVRRGKKYFVA